MSKATNPRASRPENQELHRVNSKPVSARSMRDPKAPRAPRRIWATKQMQQGASMAYQQGFTSGPLS